MYREILRDARFFELLLKIDREKNAEVRARRCPLCEGPLHSGNFERKPRGLGLLRDGAVPPDGFDVRFDLCCGWCRQRTMPESVRFLGRKVYLGVVIVIASMLARGPTRDALRLLQLHLEVSWNTLARWRIWWLELPRSGFWQSVRGLLQVELDLEALPESLLASFLGVPSDQLLKLMRLLGPLSARGFPTTLGDSR